MIKRILIIIALSVMGMASRLVAQAAVIDISQTILLEGSALNFSVIVHQSETAFFTIELVDVKGRSLQNHVINPTEGVNNYALAIPVDIQEQAWLVIRNGDQTQLQELLILPRPKQLMERTDFSRVDNITSLSAKEYMQTENICLQDHPGSIVYFSSTASVFYGKLLQFDGVKEFVNYPVIVESDQSNQAFLFDASTLKSLKMKTVENKTTVTLKNINSGSIIFAVNKLTNLPEKLDFTFAIPTTHSMYHNIDADYKNWLANQLLILEVVTPLSDKDFSAKLNSKGNTNWQEELGTATVDLKPQNYVAFDDLKSFLGGLAKNLRLYPSDDGYGSYIYPINKKASIRQPLYLIDGKIAVLDDLLAMKQEDILSIEVYTKVKSLIQTLGPVASAGLIIVKSAEPSTINNEATVGQALVPLSDFMSKGPLSPIASRGAKSQHCYDHNMRLGVFDLNGLSIDGKMLKIHSEQINIIPLSK